MVEEMGAAPQNPKAMADTRGVAARTDTDDQGIRLSYDSLHDLVGPANQVCTLTSLLLKQYGDRLGAESDALVGLIQGSVGRLQNLVAGFRLYAQITASQAGDEVCDANALLENALAPIQTAIRACGAVIRHSRLPELRCNPAQLEYVFLSLVDNAIKFRSQDAPVIHIASTAGDNCLIFSVRDNGIGIDSKNHRRIFEMFKRVHNDAYPGTGVGLAIVERIIERHRGRIWVDSQLGSGAEFVFSLPSPESLPTEVIIK